MFYSGKEFESIIATPGCGKSYLCDKFPNTFVDVDEERLKLKYVVPKGITRQELEASKGERKFEKRFESGEYLTALYTLLDKEKNEGKILLFAPHPESYDYLLSRKIAFCLVYADRTMKEEIVKRYLQRGNPKETAKNYSDSFENFTEGNERDLRPVCKYPFKENEYLEDIVFNKFGLEISSQKEVKE